MSYGITDTGFIIKDLQTIKMEIESDFRASFGNDIDISSNSPQGQVIGNQAIKFAQLWELLLIIYNVNNPDAVEGSVQDALYASNGLTRIAATPAQVPLLMFALKGTIPAGSLFQDDRLNYYKLMNDVDTSNPTDFGMAILYNTTISTEPVNEGDVFSFKINGVLFSYTAQLGDTMEIVVNELKTLINDDTRVNTVVEASVSDFIADDILAILGYTGKHYLALIGIDGGYTPFAITDLTLVGVLGGYAGLVESTVPGFLQVIYNTITSIVNPIEGLYIVTNISEGVAGKDAETDEQFRVRRLNSLFSENSCGDDAIRENIASLSDVTYSKVFSNRTDSTDDFDRPPHSLELIVLGGDSKNIAEKLWSPLSPAGIPTYGNTSVVIVDSNGDNQTISFTRPQPKYIWITLTATHSSKIDMPVMAEDAIKNYIMAWAAQNSNVYEDVLYDVIKGQVYLCPGVESVDMGINETDTATNPPAEYLTGNIEIGQRELPLFDPKRITVSII